VGRGEGRGDGGEGGSGGGGRKVEEGMGTGKWMTAKCTGAERLPVVSSR
jgi:hypothetical protein